MFFKKNLEILALPNQTIHLNKVVAIIKIDNLANDGKQNTFQINTSERIFNMLCDNEKEREMWISQLEQIRKQSQVNITHLPENETNTEKDPVNSNIFLFILIVFVDITNSRIC